MGAHGEERGGAYCVATRTACPMLSRISLFHLKYTSVSSNESDMRAQAKANATTFKAKA